MKRKKALIIDDSKFSREVAQYFMNEFDYDVEMVTNGAEALQWIQRQEADLLILDWKMPEIPGRETLIIADRILSERKILQIEKLEDEKLKVIIYSSTQIEELALPQVKALQVIGYVNKSWYLDLQKKRFRFLVRSLRGHQMMAS